MKFGSGSGALTSHSRGPTAIRVVSPREAENASIVPMYAIMRKSTLNFLNVQNHMRLYSVIVVPVIGEWVDVVGVDFLNQLPQVVVVGAE